MHTINMKKRPYVILLIIAIVAIVAILAMSNLSHQQIVLTTTESEIEGSGDLVGQAKNIIVLKKEKPHGLLIKQGTDNQDIEKIKNSCNGTQCLGGYTACVSGTYSTDGDASSFVCACGGGTWNSGLSECCGDDGSSDDWCAGGYTACVSGTYSTDGNTNSFVCSCGGGIWDPGTSSCDDSEEGEGNKDGVVCTELNRQGYLSFDDMMASRKFADENLDNFVNLGYHYWSKPLVKVMQRSSKITDLVKPLGLAWGKHMSYEMGVGLKGDPIGEIISNIGISESQELGIWLTNNNLADSSISEERIEMLANKYLPGLFEGSDEEIKQKIKTKLPRFFKDVKSSAK